MWILTLISTFYYYFFIIILPFLISRSTYSTTSKYKENTIDLCQNLYCSESVTRLTQDCCVFSLIVLARTLLLLVQICCTFVVWDVLLLTIIPVPRRSQQPQCLLFYVTSHRASRPISNGFYFPAETAPLQDAHHIWKMTCWGSRFWNIPFVIKRLSELRWAHLGGTHRICTFNSRIFEENWGDGCCVGCVVRSLFGVVLPAVELPSTPCCDVITRL